MRREVLFEKIKAVVLGRQYDLSVAFLSPQEMKAVMRKSLYKNKKPKKANHVSNVLSFPLSEASGEILLCTDVAEKECKKYFMDQRTYLAYLFIHGCLHIKGFKHSATMESEEKRIMKKFGLRPRE